MSNKCGDYITNIAAEYTFFRGAQQRLKQSKDISRFKILPSSYPSPPLKKRANSLFGIFWIHSSTSCMDLMHHHNLHTLWLMQDHGSYRLSTIIQKPVTSRNAYDHDRNNGHWLPVTAHSGYITIGQTTGAVESAELLYPLPTSILSCSVVYVYRYTEELNRVRVVTYKSHREGAAGPGELARKVVIWTSGNLGLRR